MTDAVLSLIACSSLLILSQLSPGPDIFFVLRTSLAQGYRAAIAVATGINLGFCLQAIIVCTLGTQLARQPWICWVLAAAGLWLLHLARVIMPPSRIRAHLAARRSGRSEEASSPLFQDAPAQQQTPGTARLLLRGFLCNILNPKCMLFIAGISIEALARHGTQHTWFAPALVLSLVGAAQLGWMLWSGLMQLPRMQRWYARSAFGIDAVFAALLWLFAFALFIPLLKEASALIF